MISRKRSREHLTVMCGLTRVAGDSNQEREHSASNVTRVSLTGERLDVPGKQPIELVGEELSLTLTEGSRAAGVHTAAT
jgi:hypothetical protein